MQYNIILNQINNINGLDLTKKIYIIYKSYVYMSMAP